MEQRVIEAMAFIKSSNYRRIILQILSSKISTPSEIAKQTNIRLNHVSTILAEMKKSGLIECLNESSKKRRLYALTDFGKQIINIEKNGFE
jgi:DNA-binding PadR family transcriptional regulator